MHWRRFNGHKSAAAACVFAGVERCDEWIIWSLKEGQIEWFMQERVNKWTQGVVVSFQKNCNEQASWIIYYALSFFYDLYHLSSRLRT